LDGPFRVLIKELWAFTAMPNEALQPTRAAILVFREVQFLEAAPGG
jgi:hypothetical protein